MDDTTREAIERFLADAKAYEIANQTCIIHDGVFNAAYDPEKLAARGERPDGKQVGGDAERHILTPRRERMGTHWALLESGKSVSKLLAGSGPAELLAEFLYYMDLPHADQKSAFECWPKLCAKLKVMLTAVDVPQAIHAPVATQTPPATPAPNPTETTGPFGIDGFRLGDRCEHGLSKRAMKLLLAAWPEPDHTITFADAEEKIYGLNDEPDSMWWHGPRKDANDFFRKHGFGLEVSVSASVGRITVGPIRQKKKAKRAKMPRRRP